SRAPRLPSLGVSLLSSFMGRDEREAVKLRKTLEAWPVLRQLRGGDRLGLGDAAPAPRSARGHAPPPPPWPGPAGPGRGGAVTARGSDRAPHRRCRQGRGLGLSVLCGGLRPEGLRPE